MRIIIHPARYWVSDKGQNQSRDGMVDWTSPAMVATSSGFIPMAVFLVGNGVLRLQSGRLPLTGAEDGVASAPASATRDASPHRRRSMCTRTLHCAAKRASGAVRGRAASDRPSRKFAAYRSHVDSLSGHRAGSDQGGPF